MARPKLEELDLLARRYNTLPSDIINLDVEAFQFNLLVLRVGLEAEQKAIDKQASQLRSRRGLRNG